MGWIGGGGGVFLGRFDHHRQSGKPDDRLRRCELIADEVRRGLARMYTIAAVWDSLVSHWVGVSDIGIGYIVR